MAGSAVDALLLRPLRRFLNTLLPFTDPNTPLLQDLTHAVALCAVFYFVPRFLEQRSQGQRRREVNEGGVDTGRRVGAVDGNGLDNGVGTQQGHAWDDRPLEPGEEDEELVNGFEMEDLTEEELAALPANNLRDMVHAPAQLGDDDDDDAGLADQPDQPAAPARAARTNIGPKKARSIARRDQRRAYHEFQRQQGELQRQRDAEGAEEREEAIMEEKRRRAVVEMEVEERQRKEREERKRLEESEREREMLRREEVLRKVREGIGQRGCVDLDVVGAGAEREWVRGLVKAGCILGERKTADGKKEVRLLTTGGWVVRVDEHCMKEAFRRAIDRGGTVSYEELGQLLEDVINERTLHG